MRMMRSRIAIALAVVLSIAFAAPLRAAGPAHGKTMTKKDSKTGISVTIPAGWVFTKSGPGETFHMQRRDHDTTYEARIGCGDLDGTETAWDVAEKDLARDKVSDPNFRYSEISDTTLGGYPAVTFTIYATSTYIQVYAAKDKQVIGLQLAAPTDLLPSVQGEFDFIKNSVRF